MLVLTRRPEQVVNIRFRAANPVTDVVIKVLAIEGGRVKIGFDAPNEVEIMRGELEDPVTYAP